MSELELAVLNGLAGTGAYNVRIWKKKNINHVAVKTVSLPGMEHVWEMHEEIDLKSRHAHALMREQIKWNLENPS